MSLDVPSYPRPALIAALWSLILAFLTWCASLVQSDPVTQTFLRLFSGGSLGVFAWSVWSARDRSTLLRVDADGLYYRHFAPKTVPWAEVTRVAIVRTHLLRVTWGKASHIHAGTLDQINFAIAHPENYPRSPGRTLTRAVQSADGRPPIAIQTAFLRGATAEQVLDEIRRYWGGEIEEIIVKQRGGA